MGCVLEAPSGVRIYSHLTCPTSYALFKRLRSAGLLSRVSIVDAGSSPFEALSLGIFSVPSILHGDLLLFSGYFDLDEALSFLAGKGAPRLDSFDYEEAAVQAMEGILDSYAAALWLFLTDDLGQILRARSFVEAVSRHVFYRSRGDGSFARLSKSIEDLYAGSKEIYLERLVEIVSKNLLRELAWLGRGPGSLRSTISRDVLEHLLLARAAFGRVGLLMGYRDGVLRERVSRVSSYLEDGWETLAEKVSREVSKILGDREYVEEYHRLALPRPR